MGAFLDEWQDEELADHLYDRCQFVPDFYLIDVPEGVVIVGEAEHTHRLTDDKRKKIATLGAALSDARIELLVFIETIDGLRGFVDWFQWYGMMLQQEVVPGSDPTIFDALLGENDPDGPGTAESTAERRLTAAPEKTKSPEAEAPGG